MRCLASLPGVILCSYEQQYLLFNNFDSIRDYRLLRVVFED